MWKMVRLDDVCNVRRGTVITRKEVKEGDVPVIAGGIKPAYYHDTPNRKANCITVSGSGNAGFLSFWNIPIFASDCSTIEPLDENIDIRFVYFYLLTQQQYIYDNFRFGTVQQHVYAKDIATLKLPLPSLSEQKAIVSALGTLDDKIENNKKMDEILENIVQNIFKSWFVNFDPVRAKADGKKPTGLNAEIANLFPSSFGDDDLPMGWEKSMLGDICSIKSGKRPPVKVEFPDSENNIAVYGGNGIAWYTNEVLFETPFIITGRVGTLGSVYRVYDKCWVSDNALCCFPNDKEAFEFVYFAMKKINYKSLNSGSTQPLLVQSTLQKQIIITPSKEIISAFHEQIKPLFEKISNNEKENQALTKLQKTLLPKLMSGEVRMEYEENL